MWGAYSHENRLKRHHLAAGIPRYQNDLKEGLGGLTPGGNTTTCTFAVVFRHQIWWWMRGGGGTKDLETAEDVGWW